MAEADLYTIGEVAAILGVSTHTVRAWERRHGVLQPERTRSQHRRYRLEDIELLREVKRAMNLKGLSLRLAVQTVSGSQQIETPVARGGGRRAERSTLPVQQDTWRGVADALTELIFLIDSEGRIVEANVAAARTFDVVWQQLTGRLFADLVEPFDRAKAVLLYRPRPRTVKDWELNLMTPDGARLYSFHSRSVRRGGTALQALVGSEMFASTTPEPLDIGRDGVVLQPSVTVTATNTFEALCDQLPFGVAVVTTGSEPRVVYANLRLAETLGIVPRVFTGRPLSELLPGPDVLRALRQAIATRTKRTMRTVSHSLTNLELGFQPLFSSSDQVAAVMVVVEDAAVESSLRHEVESMVADRRFEEARTPRQLRDVAMQHLLKLLPNTEFGLALIGRESGRRMSVTYSPAAVKAIRRYPAIANHFNRALREVIASGSSTQAHFTIHGRINNLTATPLTSRQPLGVLVWVEPAHEALRPERKSAINAFVARLALATELLQLRAESNRTASRLDGVVTAASVVRDSSGPTGLGARFLKELSKIVNADGAAIGQVVGSEFVVEAAYARGGAHARPGDSFPLSGQFVSTSLKTGKPTGTTELGNSGLPGTIRNALAPMRHGLSVPLVFMGRVTHVITLLRTADRPFVAEDARLVRALSGTALLAVNAGSEAPRPARSAG
jgi:PAS domain-containing protein